MDEALSTDLTPAEAPEVSTQLDDPRPSDPAQSQHKEASEPKEDPKKPQSRLDAIKRAAEDVEKANPGKEDGKEPEGKQDDPEPAKPALERIEKPEPDKSDRKHPEPPKHFSPVAKEKWLNVPYDVKIEFDRTAKDYESRLSESEQASERYAQIKEYDDLARSNGRDLRESLAKVTQIEDLMARSPLAGLNAILQEIGPSKPDGQKWSLFEVAQQIVQSGPESYQQMMAQARQQPAQPQSNQEVEQLRQQMAQMQQQQLASAVVEPFRAQHERFDELEDDIAFFLDSGRIPPNLSLHDRLAQAYDMAVRINPPSHAVPAETVDGPDPERRAGSDFGGSKSVKGAPATGVDVSARRKSKMSREEAIRAAMADAGLVN